MIDDKQRAIIREVGIVSAGALAYFGVRVAVEGSRADAEANADRIIRFERWLGVDVERTAQDVVLNSQPLRTLGNLSYVWLHWPLVIVLLVVVFHRDRSTYLRLRHALFASGAIGLVLFWLMPTAPPRFMPGFEGTVSDAARTHYLNYPLSWANEYASFPSFHIGWTLIACLALMATLDRRPQRYLAMLPAVLVALAVVTTGNHFVVDVVAGTVIALTAYWWVGSNRVLDTTSERQGDVAERPRSSPNADPTDRRAEPLFRMPRNAEQDGSST